MKQVLKITACILFLLWNNDTNAQVAINQDGSNPDASAILDVKSTNKGVLIPRMTTAQRNAISNPATGLLVFDNDINSFYYYDGSIWTALIASTNIFEHDNVNKVVKPIAANGDIANDDFVFGSLQLGDVGNSDHDQRFFFDKSKGAFRAGDVKDNSWDDANVGDFSVAFGKDTRASGKAAFAMGRNAIAAGDYSFAAGDIVQANSNYSLAMGEDAFANNFAAVAVGSDVTANGLGSVAMGFDNTAHSAFEMTLGLFATNYTPNSSLFYDANDRLFTIGNGASSDNRSDAFMVLKNGNTFINGALTIDNKYTFPTVDGTNGQVLATDGSGVLSWFSLPNNGNQTLSLNTNTLSLTNGGSVDLNGYLDNTDNQDLSLSENTLSLTNDGTTVDLSGFLDADNLGNHIATQNIRLSGKWLSGDGGGEGIFVGAGGNVRTSGHLSVGTVTADAQLHVLDDFSQTGEFVALIENTNNGSYANGLSIKAGQNIQSVNNRFISFIRPDGTEIGAVRQTSSGAVDFWSPSDRRLKTNITNTTYSLDNLMGIEVVDYHYKSDTTQLVTGFIAQQLYEHYPEAVSKGSEDVKKDPWMVNHGKVTPLLVKAVQEQQQQIEDLKAENQKLQAQASKINQLEAMLLELQGAMNASNVKQVRDD